MISMTIADRSLNISDETCWTLLTLGYPGPPITVRADLIKIVHNEIQNELEQYHEDNHLNGKDAD
jgi:hypothetical protein